MKLGLVFAGVTLISFCSVVASADPLPPDAVSTSKVSFSAPMRASTGVRPVAKEFSGRVQVCTPDFRTCVTREMAPTTVRLAPTR